jgi:hypothetical protein
MAILWLFYEDHFVKCIFVPPPLNFLKKHLPLIQLRTFLYQVIANIIVLHLIDSFNKLILANGSIHIYRSEMLANRQQFLLK